VAPLEIIDFDLDSEDCEACKLWTVLNEYGPEPQGMWWASQTMTVRTCQYSLCEKPE
jgi:hypothetical protein